MRKFISAVAAVATAISFAAIVPSAEAGPRHFRHGNNFHHSGRHFSHYDHRGRGHWHNGRWIALGVGAAIAGAAAAASDNCYWRHGYRYCD
jgi:hypothetical protein